MSLNRGGAINKPIGIVMLIPSGVLETTSSKPQADKYQEAWTGLLKEIAPPLQTALGVESIFNVFEVTQTKTTAQGITMYQVVLARHHTAPELSPDLWVLTVRWLAKRRLAAVVQPPANRKPVAGNNHGRVSTGPARRWRNGN